MLSPWEPNILHPQKTKSHGKSLGKQRPLMLPEQWLPWSLGLRAMTGAKKASLVLTHHLPDETPTHRTHIAAASVPTAEK